MLLHARRARSACGPRAARRWITGAHAVREVAREAGRTGLRGIARRGTGTVDALLRGAALGRVGALIGARGARAGEALRAGAERGTLAVLAAAAKARVGIRLRIGLGSGVEAARDLARGSAALDDAGIRAHASDLVAAASRADAIRIANLAGVALAWSAAGARSPGRRASTRVRVVVVAVVSEHRAAGEEQAGDRENRSGTKNRLSSHCEGETSKPRALNN